MFWWAIPVNGKHWAQEQAASHCPRTLPAEGCPGGEKAKKERKKTDNAREGDGRTARRHHTHRDFRERFLAIPFCWDFKERSVV